MQGVKVSMLLFLALLVPESMTAQVYWTPTPPPQTTAAASALDGSGEPVWFAGVWYYRTGPTVFFNGATMSQVGEYRGIVLYADSTLEAFSVVYIPVGHNLMRPYERRRAGDLAATTGSRVPSFPVQIEAEAPQPPVQGGPVALLETAAQPAPSGEAAPQSAVDLLRRTPQPAVEIWIEFDGGRWYRSGAAVPFVSTRFAEAGEYRGFPVYRDKDNTADRIYIPSVAGGLLVPYAKR